MRILRQDLAVAFAAAVVACSPEPRPDVRDTAARAAAADDVSREEAIRLARDYVVRQQAASVVYLDSTEAEVVDSLWRVTFRRRALVVPAVLTVDVHRRTRALRFPGDE